MIADQDIGSPLLDSIPPAAASLGEFLDASIRSYGVWARLVPEGQGVLIEGVSLTYYGKQMAQELLRRANFVVVANRIRVDRSVCLDEMVGKTRIDAVD